MTIFYTGIGSRQTPQEALNIMEYIASALKRKGFVMRSGGAGGADSAFGRGAGKCSEIYIPWNGFGTEGPRLYHGEDGVIAFSMLDIEKQKECEKIASEIHPAWNRCSRGARALHSRNVLQVKGLDDTLSDFVIYWSNYDKNFNPKGGTATAVNLATSLKIPTFNLNIPMDCNALKEFILTNYKIALEF